MTLFEHLCFSSFIFAFFLNNSVPQKFGVDEFLGVLILYIHHPILIMVILGIDLSVWFFDMHALHKYLCVVVGFVVVCFFNKLSLFLSLI